MIIEYDRKNKVILRTLNLKSFDDESKRMFKWNGIHKKVNKTEIYYLDTEYQKPDGRFSDNYYVSMKK